MSKKNNKKTRSKQHAFDLQREKAAVQKKQSEAVKTHAKLAAKAPGLKKKKKAGIRVRKGVTIQVRGTRLRRGRNIVKRYQNNSQGIKVKDSATKKKAIALLEARKAAVAAAIMDED